MQPNHILLCFATLAATHDISSSHRFGAPPLAIASEPSFLLTPTFGGPLTANAHTHSDH